MPRPSTGLILATTFALGTVLAPPARGDGPADDLFRLVPPDAGVTLAIEDLRGHARDFFASPLAVGIGRLPAVRASRESGRLGRLEQSLGKVESLLGASVSKIRDDLLGDAVVLALRLAPDGKPEDARGLLLVRPRDRALLDRLIRGCNAAQLKSGELARVAERARGGSSYSVREYRRAGRAAESYAVLDDGTFAWSNSEELILGVIDRKAGKVPGLSADPRFRKVRGRLPARAAASLFVDPALLRSAVAALPASSRPSEAWLVAAVVRYLGAVEYAGAALQWRDGFIVHTEEAIDPAKLDPAFRPPGGPPRSPWRGVPATALAVASVRVDPGAVLDLARRLLREPGRLRLDDLIVGVGGLMLGRDVRAAILPRLGPGVTAFVDAPGSGGGSRPWFPIVAMLDLEVGDGEAGVSDAIDNGLRTALAYLALDEKAGGGPRRLVARTIRETAVTTLDRDAPFAYALRRDRLAIGNRAEAVAPALGGEEPEGSSLAALRSAYFPDSDTFACADLTSMGSVARMLREPISRRVAARRGTTPEAAARDLNEALALVALFRGAFVTSTTAPDASSIHRTLGLIARDAVPGRPWPGTPGAK